MGSIREHIKKSGEKSFHAEVRLKGFPPQRASFRTKSQAKKWVQDTESAIRDGRYNSSAVSRRHTVKELIERFITQHLSREVKYKRQKTSHLMKWIDELGHLALSELRPYHLANIRDKLQEEITPRGSKRAPGTANRYLAAFSKVLSFAVNELEWLEENPMRKISKPKESQGRDRFLSRREIECLLNACEESSNKNLYPIVSIALVTGMRYGEIVNLKWKDVDFDNRFIYLNETKNGSKRVIPLTDKLIDIFHSCQSYGKGLEQEIFSNGLHYRSKNTYSIRKSFATALKRAGIENFRFHDLRHTAASHLAMGGATQGELMTILGHRTPAMTRRYAHYSQGHIANVLEKTSSIIDQKKEG